MRPVNVRHSANVTKSYLLYVKTTTRFPTPTTKESPRTDKLEPLQTTAAKVVCDIFTVKTLSLSLKTFRSLYGETQIVHTIVYPHTRSSANNHRKETWRTMAQDKAGMAT